MIRRQFLAGLVAAGTIPTTGCLESVGAGTPEATPTPVDLSGGKADDRGGMIIGDHGGPNGQIFYADHTPEGHDNPAWFHTLSFGMFPYYFEHDRLGWEATAIYATDYSRVDYAMTERNGTPVISAPTAPETFGTAKELTYVVHSDVHGGMGPDLIPFSEDDDVGAFIDQYGGQPVTFADITPEFLSQYVG